jgi:hypothetical protein
MIDMRNSVMRRISSNAVSDESQSVVQRHLMQLKPSQPQVVSMAE